ncbi:MAG: hypothetical protein KF678_11000 [Phycisphaeraceae bacterium]|nr:hypothetical protein [Phycisphaeraceae bacterium]
MNASSARASMPTTIPADRILWSIIEAPNVKGMHGPIPAGLWPVIEDDLPIAADSLWAVSAPIDGQRLAVCAALRADLDIPGALILTPESVPEFIPADPSAFNLLVGEYEPKAIRRLRTRRHLLAAAGVLLVACLIATGLSRRAAAWRAEAEAAQGAVRHVTASVANRAVWSREDLILELAQRRQSAPAEVVPPEDAAVSLAAVIAMWPAVPAKAQSITATGRSASIAVTIPGDAQPFLAAFKPPSGWMLHEPRLVAVDQAKRLNLELRKEAP